MLQQMQSCYYEKIGGIALAVLDNCDYYGSGRIITRINTPAKHRGQGIAGRLLRQIIVDADALGIDLWLEIAPSDGLDYDQLRAWYERHGFRDVGGIFKRKHR